MATSTLPSWGAPPLQSGGGGGGSEKAHKWAKWLHHLPSRGSPPLQCGGGGGGGEQKWPTIGQSGYITPAVLGSPSAAERGGGGGGIRSGPLVGKVATSPLPSDPHRFRAGGGGGESEKAHKWAKWLHHLPSRGSPPLQCLGGGGIRSGPQLGKVATSPLPSRPLFPLVGHF